MHKRETFVYEREKKEVHRDENSERIVVLAGTWLKFSVKGTRIYFIYATLI